MFHQLFYARVSVVCVGLGGGVWVSKGYNRYSITTYHARKVFLEWFLEVFPEQIEKLAANLDAHASNTAAA